MNRFPIAWSVLAVVMIGSLMPSARASAMDGGLGDHSDASPEATLRWQKVELEDRLLDKINRALSPSLPREHYVASVTITLKEPEGKGADADDKKPATPEVGAKEVKSDDESLDLGKLDVTVPYQDPRIDVFSSIDSIKVSVMLDNSLPEAKGALVKSIITDVVASISDEEPEIEIKKGDLVFKPVENWDAKKWVSTLALPITLLLGALAFCAILFVISASIMGSYRKLENRRIAVMEAQGVREDAAAQREIAAAAEAAKQLKESEATATQAEQVMEDSKHDEVPAAEVGQKGIDRLQAILKKDPEKISELIRQWLKAPGKGALEALTVLPHILAPEELLELFKVLTMSERKEWRRYLARPIDADVTQIADQFIGTQILESLLDSAPKIDDAIQAEVSSLTISEALRLAENDPALGAVLFNVMPPKQVGRLLAAMSSELASKVTLASLKLSDDEIQAQALNLKPAIDKVKTRVGGAETPFVGRATDLIADLDPEREAALLEALLQAGQQETVEAAARRYFPSELVLKLPPKLLKTCLEKLAVPRRAELIVSRPADQRTALLNAIGKEGSKAREMFGVALQEVDGDELRRKRLEKDSARLWKDFIDGVRGYLDKSEAAAQQASPVLEAWIAERCQRDGNVSPMSGQSGDGGADGGTPDSSAAA